MLDNPKNKTFYFKQLFESTKTAMTYHIPFTHITIANYSSTSSITSYDGITSYIILS